MRLSLTLLLMSAVGVLSLTPDRDDPGGSAFVWVVHLTPALLQKTLHVALYAALSVAWLRTMEPLRARYLWALVIPVSYGAILEWLQTFIPGRFGGIMDVILNTAGAMLGLALARVAARRT